ncbi:MAG: aminomethyl-transferring glycine dehydrogenase subunit GcvPA [bacterium]|nr:aminomethyl-transferring glycine dehydrogenase subunit GcvPA [bacterium]
MPRDKDLVHPYIPNSVPAIRDQLLREIGAGDIEDLYTGIPEALRLKRPLDVPGPLLSEYELRQHVEGLLRKNRSCQEYLNFKGGGCWQHYVPAVCDEIASRGEFVTAYVGDTYSDLGKHQAIFEFQSLLGELLEMDVVSSPTYDWACAASSALLMAARITGRKQVLVPAGTGPERLAHVRNFCRPVVNVETVATDPVTGLLDLDDLRRKLSSRTACVYLENPTYLGLIEHRGATVAEMAHAFGALLVVGVDPTSLGVISPPIAYGADIVCGEAQPLGIHMNYGGGVCGFIASRDDETFVAEYNTFLTSIAETREGGEFGFGWSTFDRTSFVKRDTSPDYTGSNTALWGITAGVYLALMGPQGMADLGKTIMQRSYYAMKRLGELNGVTTPVYPTTHFKEFVVTFDRPVADVNRALLGHRIFGGIDLSASYPELGNSALYCVTEIHSREAIERLVDAVKEVLR